MANIKPDITFFQTTIENVKLNIAFKFRSVSRDLIFFLHGLGCSMKTFEHAFLNEDLREYSLLAIDFPGFGNSSKPDNFSYSLRSHAKCIEHFIEIYPAFRLHIVGHSMGSAVGLLLSDNILKSVISFVNVEGNLIKEDCSLISREATRHSFKKFQEQTFKKLVNPRCNPDFKYFDLSSSSSVAFYNSAKSLVQCSENEKLLNTFQRLNAHKIYFYGDKNSKMDILCRLADVEKKSVSQSGHFLMEDNPNEFYSKLHSFLTQAKLKKTNYFL